MLKISNLKWKYKDFTNINSLVKIMSLKFKALNVVVKITSNEETVITFNDIVDGKTFISSVDNKIIMKASDPRIKKTGRNYLLSKRPTEEQYHGFFNIIQDTLDILGLAADVELIPKQGDKIYLRRGNEKNMNLIKVKNFPIKINKEEVT